MAIDLTRPAKSPDVVLARVISIATILLGIATWRLWGPQRDFPQVPLLAVANGVPRWVDALAAIGLLLTLLRVVCTAHRPSRRRTSLCIAISLFAVLFLLDQHRLQPWAYHFVLAAWALALCGRQSMRWLRWLTISIYLFSAIGKLDAAFANTLGALFVRAGLRLIGIPEDALDGETISRIALVLPTAELVVAFLLLWPRSRLAGVAFAVVMHAVLLVLLGPLGLNHRWPVLIWNVSCLLQVLVLFGPTADTATRDANCSAAQQSWLAKWSAIPLVLAMALPVFEGLGWWDAWLSWGLYSARVTKAEVYLPAEQVTRLPVALKAYCPKPVPGQIWARCRIDRWSLETLQAPIYPHQRFQLGVAVAIMRALPESDRQLRIVLCSVPDRFSGKVERRTCDGLDEAMRVASEFRVNAVPRAQP